MVEEKIFTWEYWINVKTDYKTIAKSSEKTLICVLDDCKTVGFQGLSIIENLVLNTL